LEWLFIMINNDKNAVYVIKNFINDKYKCIKKILYTNKINYIYNNIILNKVFWNKFV